MLLRPPPWIAHIPGSRPPVWVCTAISLQPAVARAVGAETRVEAAGTAVETQVPLGLGSLRPRPILAVHAGRLQPAEQPGADGFECSVGAQGQGWGCNTVSPLGEGETGTGLPSQDPGQAVPQSPPPRSCPAAVDTREAGQEAPASEGGGEVSSGGPDWEGGDELAGCPRATGAGKQSQTTPWACHLWGLTGSRTAVRYLSTALSSVVLIVMW